jgi:hypothetical protein
MVIKEKPGKDIYVKLMVMTEQELIDLNFIKQVITDKESDNGFDFYFYQKEICEGLILHSIDNKTVENNNWILNCFEIPALKIKTVEHYQQFLEIIEALIQ